jgi:hypothetical protein
VARENAQMKGRRYVSEGRLTVRHVDADSVRAVCQGDGVIYNLGYRNGRWACPCPALGRCSHLVALGLVVAPESRR